MHRVPNDAPATVAGRDVVPNVPDLFGNVAVWAFEADAAHGPPGRSRVAGRNNGTLRTASLPATVWRDVRPPATGNAPGFLFLRGYLRRHHKPSFSRVSFSFQVRRVWDRIDCPLNDSRGEGHPLRTEIYSRDNTPGSAKP
jgi:hypothetical protein